jgi:hypothetical protein
MPDRQGHTASEASRGDVDAFVAEAEFVPPVGGEFRVVSAESFNLA